MTDEYDLESGPDPATFAAAAPEPDVDDTDHLVSVVGVGPGNLEYLTPRGERAIREADVVVGFATVVEFVAECTGADLLTCGYADEAETLAAFAERVAAGESGTAVAMGDPNHSGYQFVGKVQEALRREDPAVTVRVRPGISAIQVAASRARTPLEESTFVTLHKSGDLAEDLRRLAAATGDRHVLVLPRPYDVMPGDIAQFVLDHGADPTLEALVLEKLTHDAEQIHRFTLGELASHAGGETAEETPFSDLVVLAIRRSVTIE